MFPLRSDRLLIRPMRPDDALALSAVYGDPEVMRFVGDGRPADRAGVEQMVAGYRRHQQTHGFGFWAVVDRAQGDVIGDAGFEARGEGAEFGYTLHRAWWGRGLATEAGRLCLAAAFGPLGLAWLSALADRDNPASARVLDKLGFTRCGEVNAYGRPHHAYRLRAAARP